MKALVDDAALAEIKAFNEDLQLRLAQMPPVHTLPPEVVRQGRRDGKSVFPPLEFLPQARDMAIPTRNGEIRLRVLAPEREAAGVYLHIHGGGWVLGGCDEQDVRLWSLVEATGPVRRQRRVPPRAGASVSGGAGRLRGRCALAARAWPA